MFRAAQHPLRGDKIYPQRVFFKLGGLMRCPANNICNRRFEQEVLDYREGATMPVQCYHIRCFTTCFVSGGYDIAALSVSYNRSGNGGIYHIFLFATQEKSSSNSGLGIV